MTEITATNDSIATQAGRDSVVHADDRTVYKNCTVTIHIRHHERGAIQSLALPVVLVLLLLIIYSAHKPSPEVVHTPYEKTDRSVQVEIQIYTLDV